MNVSAEPPPSGRRKASSGLLRFALFVLFVVAAAIAGLRFYESLHGARFDGSFIEAEFLPPAGFGAASRVQRYVAPLLLAEGSGSLRARFTDSEFSNGRSVVSRLRVERGDWIAPGVTASVTVTDYAVFSNNDPRNGHVTLEVVEVAADGRRTHHVELRADGTLLDPDAPRPVPVPARADEGH